MPRIGLRMGRLWKRPSHSLNPVVPTAASDTRTTLPSTGSRDREGSCVEQFVVKDTERDAVPNLVRSTRLMPLDVRGVERHRPGTDADIEVAHRASVFVGPQHHRTKAGISHRAALPGGEFGIDTDRLEDVVVLRVLKMCGEEIARGPGLRVGDSSGVFRRCL